MNWCIVMVFEKQSGDKSVKRFYLNVKHRELPFY